MELHSFSKTGTYTKVREALNRYNYDFININIEKILDNKSKK